MTCQYAEEQIQVAVDGLLSPNERRNLDKHITECAACADLMDDYRELKIRGAEWAQSYVTDCDPGEPMNDRVLAAVANRLPGAQRMSLHILAGNVVFAAVLAGTAVVAGAYIRTPTPLIEASLPTPSLLAPFTTVGVELEWLEAILNKGTSLITDGPIGLSLYIPLAALILTNLFLFRINNKRRLGAA